MAKQTFTSGQVLTAAQMTSLQQTAMLGGDASAKTSSYTLVAADAGTAISMSNASATTITVNTGLFAAGDIVTIVNLGAGVCTITAGTATVATSGSLALAQNQGGVLRFTSASAAIFFQFATPASGDIEGVTAGTGISGGGTSGTVTITNSMATEITASGDIIVGTGSGTFDNLPIGTTGQVLTADTTVSPYKVKWAAAASGGYTELASGTASGASLDLTSISGSYRNLQLIWRNVRPASNGEQLLMRFNSDTNGRYVITDLNAADGLNPTQTSMSTDPGTNSGATNANTIKVITVYDYANTSTYKFAEVISINTDETTNTLVDFRRRAGIYNQTGAITALNFLWTGSVNFNGGTYVLYGVK